MRKFFLAGAAVMALTVGPIVSSVADAASEVPSDAVPPPPGSDPAGSSPSSSEPSTPGSTPPVASDPTQSGPAATTPAGEPKLTARQQAAHDAWPPERQADYAGWPPENKAYFWTLPPERQEGYWALTAEQRGQIYKMSPQQREIAWQSVMQQLKGQAASTANTVQKQANPPGGGTPTSGPTDPHTASEPVPPAMPADQSYHAGPYKGALTPPPATEINKTYPVCTRKIQDNCRNPGGK